MRANQERKSADETSWKAEEGKLDGNLYDGWSNETSRRVWRAARCTLQAGPTCTFQLILIFTSEVLTDLTGTGNHTQIRYVHLG